MSDMQYETADPAHVTLTTDHVTSNSAGLLADAMHTAGVAVEHLAFLSVPDPVHPWGVLLLATDGPPLALARFIAPATAPVGVASALVAVLRVGQQEVPAMLQLKANGVFVSLQAQNLIDITRVLDALPAQLTHLDTRHGERRLVYSEGAWRIDP